MKEHIIVDVSYLYYKYKYTLMSNRLRRLTTKVAVENEEGIVEVKDMDVSNIYYPLREIEGFRREAEKRGSEVVMSICFDSKSFKKENNAEYKSNRTNKLDDSDFENMNIIRRLLEVANHNVYKIDGLEADDIIANLVREYGQHFDLTTIYTPDADMMVLVNDRVHLMRYKSRKGYVEITRDNYEEACMEEFKCYIPYNAILLYKVLCGDKSDCIKGVKGFGPAAFDRFVKVYENKINWEKLGDVDYLEKVIESCLNDKYIDEAKKSLELVRFIDIVGLKEPSRQSCRSSREEAYGKYSMKSLID